MSEENSQDISPPNPEVQESEAKEPKADGSRSNDKEICTCGHSASKHTASRYTCQAPGDRKGFCPCMRFVPRSSPIGQRMRSRGRPKRDRGGSAA